MKLPAFLRVVGAFIIGVVVTFTLLIAVELFSAIVHPFPPDFRGTQEEMCAHVARYPHWVLAAVVPMWGFIAYLGTWITGLFGHRGAAILMALLLLAAVIFNMSMLPYPLWFKIVQPLAVLLCVYSGCRLATCQRAGIRPRTPEHESSP